MPKKSKLASDLMRLINAQDFQNEKQLEEFMNSIVGKPLPEFEQEELSKEEQAEQLVYDAYEKPELAIEYLIQALLLDENCLMAYEFLAMVQPHPLLSIPYYTHAISIGRKVFDKEFVRKNKGHFWHMVETRPFMKLLFNYALALVDIGKLKDALTLLEEILSLNPNDNMGARHHYMIYLIADKQFSTFEKVLRQFKDDNSASFLFNTALYEFITTGDNKNSMEALKKAIKENKFIIAKLTAKNRPENIEEAYSPGSIAEADIYSFLAWKTWQQFPEAIAWIKNSKKKK